MNGNKKLKPGEKYLSGSLGGKTGIKFALFPNRNKEKDTDPDFIGSIPLAVWVNKKKAESSEQRSSL